MERLYTRWGKVLDKEHPLNEYPRPQMKRDSFINLNGVWKYAILEENKKFSGYQGDIVVPFSPETILSGVEKTVSPNDILYYQKSFNFTKTNRRVLLHFGAVDYECTVTLNGKELGSHKGGYFPFSFDVTAAILDGENDLRLAVKDPSNEGIQARGKQTFKRGQIWYTPQSGIWQTVWLEEVCEDYIESIKLTPDIDNNKLDIELKFSDRVINECAAMVTDKGEIKAACKIIDGKGSVTLTDYELWSPENPYLYEIKIAAGDDRIESYFGMRKFSRGLDENGVPRFMLNNKPYFFNGLLDQGYWSDGMYTAPSDEALVYDIQTMKDLGFNTLRKHIKIEPLRWYYHCDRLGMIVWQDMINGGREYNFAAIGVMPFFGLCTTRKQFGRITDGKKHYKFYSRQDEDGRKEYYVDSERMIDHLYNVTSLAMWVPFNEAWGQFDSVKACDFTAKDPTRLIDHASGWVDHGAGDVNSFHIYFTPFWFPKYNKNDDRPIGLTEYGGFSMRPEGHAFNLDKLFGYRIYKTQEKFDSAIKHLFEERVAPAVKKGLSAAIYTEVSDVEDEVNGLLSYDREVLKVTPEIMKAANEKIKL